MDRDISVHNLTPRRKLDFVVDAEKQSPEKPENQPPLISDSHAAILEGKIPKIGMEFDSEEVAYNFYNEYARVAGFSIRRHTVHPDREGRIVDRTFCCSCRGYRPKDKRDVSVKSHRPETRSGCKAMMKINGRTGKYKVVSFIADHSGHDLVSPTKTHLLRSHRSINTIQASQADDMESSGITPRAGFTLMAKQAGGRENVGFILEDYKNYLRTKRTREMQAGDTGGVLEYLQKRQLKDPNFFYAIQVDEDDLIANVFWVDAQMMADYTHFGDVVCFYTTYRKNKDGRPFALFVGVNHHKQTVIFGASLLYDETASTFKWLFDTFATTMSEKKPITILTDQDAAMAKALAETWPTTYHRLCIWHIYQNAAIHLSNVFSSFTDFAKDLRSCIYDYEEEEEFLTAWNEMLEKFDLQSNPWLQRMFGIREKWALVYGRQTFCADLITTQRSESMHGVLKRYVSNKHNLFQFFHHFDRLIDDRRYEELKADLRASRTTPVTSFPVEILKHAASVYTHEVFALFQDELRKSYDAKIELFSQVGDIFEYKVTPFHRQRQHAVTYASSQGKIVCSCKKFEFAGILCSHALKVYSLKGITKIPERYIMKRWTRKAKKVIVEAHTLGGCDERSESMNENDEKNMIGVHYKALCGFTNLFATRGALTMETFQIAKNGILELLEKIDASLENTTVSPPTRGKKNIMENKVSNEAANTSREVVVRGWKNKEKKVGKSGKRIMSGLEKSIRKRKQNQSNVSLSNNVVVNTQNIDQNGEKSLNFGPVVEPRSQPFLSQTSQVDMSSSSIGYSIERPSLHVEPFQFAQVFNPIIQQQPNLSHYSRENEKSNMTLTELLQQEIAKSHGLEMAQLNKSVQQGEHGK